MKSRVPVAAVLYGLFALSLHAQSWSFGAATGPFGFGDLAERTVRAGNGSGPGNVSHLKLTAKTRGGLALDVERELTERFAVRLEGTFTSSPLAAKSSGGNVGIDSGRLNVSTWMLPVVLRLNPRGSVRFHLAAGPAYAIYHIHRRTAPGAAIVPYAGTRGRFGGAAAAGLAWWLSNRFAIEGQAAYIRTSSPFELSDFVAPDVMHIPRPQNVHTTVGMRWRF